MAQRRITRLLGWIVLASILIAGGYVLLQLSGRLGGEVDRDSVPGEPPPAAIAGIVEVEPEAAQRLGIATEEAKSVAWTAHSSVYGRVVPNARATSEVRATYAGVLRVPPDATWPVTGQPVKRGQMLGYVEVRVGPELRLDLQNKLSEARIKQRGEEEVVKVREQMVGSLKKVTDNQILSRAELDTALVGLAEQRTQLASANAAVDLWEKSLREVEEQGSAAVSVWRQPLVAPGDGVVTELNGRPGMAVEPGTLLLQVVDFHRPLVRLDLPPALLAGTSPPSEITLQPAISSMPSALGVSTSPSQGDLLAPRKAQIVGPAPSVDFSSQLVGVWYDVYLPELDVPAIGADLSTIWRPGLQVKAEIPAAAASTQAATVVPASAVLFHEGRSLVYVRTAEDRYERREVRLLSRDGDEWIIEVGDRSGVGVRPGEAVVAGQPQVLLSKEFLKGGGDVD